MKERERGLIIIDCNDNHIESVEAYRKAIHERKSIGVVCHVGHGKTTLIAALHDKINEITKKDFDSFMAHDEKRENAIEINGEFYQEIQKPKPKFHIGEFNEGRKRELKKVVDIVQEFRLIGLKQSTLTKWEREEVKRIFEQNFTKI